MVHCDKCKMRFETERGLVLEEVKPKTKRVQLDMKAPVFNVPVPTFICHFLLGTATMEVTLEMHSC